MQGIPNPVPRVRHPDWLHKKMLEKNDNFKQRRISDMFSVASKPKPIEIDSSNGNSHSTRDIEDIGTNKNKSLFKMPTVATVSKRKRDKENPFSEDDLNKTWRDVLGNPPLIGNTREELTAWILFQKKKWLFQSSQKNEGHQNKKKKTNSNVAVLRSSAPGTLGDFIQRAQRSLLTTPWQIIQIVPTAVPGDFKLWALVHNELHQVKLVVPRIFYANLRTPKVVEEGALYKKCNRMLPRARQVLNLYMYTVPEEVYQEHGKKLFLDQSDPNVEGVYETQVTSLFRALVQVGCVCKVSSRVSNMESFDMEQLDKVSISRQPYLSKGSVKRLYFYHHKHMSKAQHMFALFLTPIKKAIVIVLDTVKTNLMPNMTNLYQAERLVKVEKNPDEDLLPPVEITFEVKIETSIAQVYKVLQKTLQSYKDEKKGPTLLAIQSAMEIGELQHNVSNLMDFPQVQIHVQDIDELYNVIDWQNVGARAIVRHYLNSDRVIELMTEQCRYFHVPLGNMPADPAIFGSDLFFARHLINHNHVLWFSTTDKPDLGGSQENDARLLAENQEGSSEVCNVPGWYSSVCVELDVDSLAINTLLQSHHVTDIEGMSNISAFDASEITSIDSMISGNQNLTNYDETSRCAESFKILRTMAVAWMRDISIHRNVFADFQVIHFYRWMRSPNAYLYDPALLRTLQNLMKKLFLQLVAEFKRLGCMIIYANFNKIIICSKKTTVEDAIANVEFVVTSIRNKELFHSLEITYRQCWEQLVWLDTANFGGIKGKLPENIENESLERSGENNGDEEDDEDSNEPIVEMKWNVAELLPEQANCRNNFNAVIAGYINAIYTNLRQNDRSTISRTILSQPSFGLAQHENVVDYAKELLAGEISQTLFRMTEKIHNRLLPLPDGTNPALEFVKIICHIIGLDPALRDAVDTLRSNLLRLIGVGEFSEIAVWRDPTVSYIIPEIICRACNHCRDIDLGRDQFRSDSAWLCPLCNSEYDNAEIQCIMLNMVNKKLLAYSLQDLQCKKCAQIKLENINKHCNCSADFKCLISRTDLIKLLQTFQSLALKFNMPALSETVDQVLNLA